MRKIIITLLLSGTSLVMTAQQKLNEMVNLERYAKDDQKILKKNDKKIDVVLIGNSITEGWVNQDSTFFKTNNYVGRGISGQTSPQLLLRFRQDVLDLKPKAVVINIGTNDIAENTGAYNPKFTLDNIKSMAELAQANGIKVILSAVLPVGKYPWSPEIKDVPQKIDELNKNIKAYAIEKKLPYIDYNTAMRDENGAMRAGLADDGVHPNMSGYVIMEKLAKEAINKVLVVKKAKK